MKQTFISLLIGSIFLSGCQKEINFTPPVVAESCHVQTDNPAGRYYASDAVIPVNYTKRICGFLPLSKNSYWIYKDSVFNDGTFIKVQYDTLRFNSTWKSLTDSLIWWQSSISIGLPERLYATDSSLFEMASRDYDPDMMDAKKSYGLFEGDSIHYLASFDDNMALGRSVKMQDVITTPAGSFEDYILFEKNARNYRLDQVYFKPGFGVIKYIMQRAPVGTGTIQLQQISTLVAFHFD